MELVNLPFGISVGGSKDRQMVLLTVTMREDSITGVTSSIGTYMTLADANLLIAELAKAVVEAQR